MTDRRTDEHFSTANTALMHSNARVTSRDGKMVRFCSGSTKHQGSVSFEFFPSAKNESSVPIRFYVGCSVYAVVIMKSDKISCPVFAMTLTSFC